MDTVPTVTMATITMVQVAWWVAMDVTMDTSCLCTQSCLWFSSHGDIEASVPSIVQKGSERVTKEDTWSPDRLDILITMDTSALDTVAMETITKTVIMKITTRAALIQKKLPGNTDCYQRHTHTYARGRTQTQANMHKSTQWSLKHTSMKRVTWTHTESQTHNDLFTHVFTDTHWCFNTHTETDTGRLWRRLPWKRPPLSYL